MFTISKAMSDKEFIEVVGVLSEILSEQQKRYTLYYFSEGAMRSFDVKCRILKVRRNMKIKFLTYTYIMLDGNPIIIDGKVLRCFTLHHKTEEIWDSLLLGDQYHYDIMLRMYSISDVYEKIGSQYHRVDNGFDRMLNWAKEAIYKL